MASGSSKKKGRFSTFIKDSASLFHRPSRRVAVPYQPLRQSDIRLLNILPSSGGNPDEQISCTIDQVELDDNPDYDALSYVWGDVSQQKQILLEGRPVHVTINLYDALWQFRHLQERSYGKRYLWVDALCLNQTDQQEKLIQIPRMSAIYQKAREVVIWLGFNTIPDPEMTFLIGEINSAAIWFHDTLARNVPGGGELVDSYPHKERLQEARERILPAYQTVWQRAWFTRMWVIQEAILARRDPVVYISHHKMHLRDLGIWDIFFLPQLLAIRDTHALLNTLGIAEHFKALNIDIGYPEELPPELRVATILRIALGKIEGRQQSVPHDRVYSLLGLVGGVLAGRDIPKELLPDYELPLETVFHQYISYIIRQTGELSLLSSSARELSDKVPSWVPDLRYCDSGGDLNKTKVLLSEDSTELRLEVVVLGVCASHVPSWEPDADPNVDRQAWSASVRHRKAELADTIILPSHLVEGTPERHSWDIWLRCNNTYTGEPVSASKEAYDAVSGALDDLCAADKITEGYNRMRDQLLKGIALPHLVLENGVAMQVLRDAQACQGDVICRIDGLQHLWILRPMGEGKHELVAHCKPLSKYFPSWGKFESWGKSLTPQTLTLI